MLQTDGVSVCFHFHLPKVEKTVHNDYVPNESDRVIGIDLAVAILSTAWMINSKKHTV